VGSIPTVSTSMKTSLFVLGFVLTSWSAVALAAAHPHVVPLWSGKPPGDPLASTGPEADLTKPSDRPVAGKPVIRLGNVTTPTLSVFLPPKEKRTGAAFIICPGGGFNILAFDLEGTEVAEWLNSIGIAGIVLKYRVPTAARNPKWLAPVQDAQRAASLVRSRAHDWGLDPQRIGLLGFSAGGMTAGMATLKHAARTYEPTDEADKVSCRPDLCALIYPAYFADAQSGQLIPEAGVNKETPSMFLAHAFDDPVTPMSSVLLFAALKQAGVRSELHIYESGGHGYGLRATESPVTSWPSRCEDWLRRQGWLKPRAAQ